MLRPLVSGFLGEKEIVCRIDQSDVRKRLWEVADEPLRPRVVFLRQETDVVAEPNQSLEDPARLIGATKHQKVVSEPKATSEEGALADRQAVSATAGVVAHDETVDHEIAFDRRHRPDNARIARRPAVSSGCSRPGCRRRIAA
jgi:hypothetical protein